MHEREIISKEWLLAERARRHHVHFIEYMWQRRDTRFIIGRHTEYICGILDEAIEKYKQGVSSYLLIKIPVRHGKSDIGSRYFPANFLGKFPDKEVIVAGYAYSLVRGFSRECKAIIEDQRYQMVYPGVQLAKRQRSIDNWGIEGAHGQTHWIGIGGAATGKGGDAILVDDSIKNRKEAESEVIRDYKWESIASDIFTRRAPVCICVFIGTPWHVDDMFGRIEKKQKELPGFPQFQDITMPAFSDSYPNGVLFPERFSMDWYVAEQAMLGPYASAGLLQCQPIARGGNIFEVDKIKYYDTPPDDVRWCRGWDLASSEKERIAEDPDYTAGVKVGVRWILLSGGAMIPQIYIDDVVDGRWSAPMRDKTIQSVAIGDGSGTQIAVESYGPYKDAYENLRKALTGIRTVKKMQLPGDKVSKASVLEAPIAAGNFYIRKASWNERFLKQMREFPGSAHDDIVDATVVGFEGHEPYEKRVWPQFQGRHIIKIGIDWERTADDYESSLHYAGMWQKQDLSVWVVLALWDAYRGYLFIYDAFMCPDIIPTIVCTQLIERMQLNKYRSESVLTNKMMWETHGYSKNIAQQYRNYLKKRATVKIKEAQNYDEYAAIVEIGQLFDQNMVYVEKTMSGAVLQLMSWVTVDRGQHTGHRPDEDDDGYCRALCLIVSELRRKKRWSEIVTPKLHDYVDARYVQKVYQDAAEIGVKKTEKGVLEIK